MCTHVATEYIEVIETIFFFHIFSISKIFIFRHLFMLFLLIGITSSLINHTRDDMSVSANRSFFHLYATYVVFLRGRYSALDSLVFWKLSNVHLSSCFAFVFLFEYLSIPEFFDGINFTLAYLLETVLYDKFITDLIKSEDD